MRIERTITRENGDEVVIDAFALLQGGEIAYYHSVKVKGKRKRKYEYLAHFEESQCVTPAEIHAVKMELWESLKPKM